MQISFVCLQVKLGYNYALPTCVEVKNFLWFYFALLSIQILKEKTTMKIDWRHHLTLCVTTVLETSPPIPWAYTFFCWIPRFRADYERTSIVPHEIHRSRAMVSSVSTAHLCCTKYALETALQCIRKKKLDVEYNILLSVHTKCSSKCSTNVAFQNKVLVVN